jgi:hypothetical protein
MEIRKKDIEQSKELIDLYNDLIAKYYTDYDDISFDKLDIVTQTFVLIVNADGEINNGGIVQFIDNGTGNYFHETIKAANRINSEGLVNMLTKAARQFPDGQIPKDWSERRYLYDELSDQHSTYLKFDDLDIKAKEIFLQNHDSSIPLDQISIVEMDSWGDVWDELDSWYYENSNIVYQNLIDFLKINATLID